ncbi:MAG TPA: hypothetical protein VKA18_00795, partial [Alphaproteobacteria bacterium]|nr:hypothetical protein [Alphaproteobacteria bacterium]
GLLHVIRTLLMMRLDKACRRAPIQAPESHLKNHRRVIDPNFNRGRTIAVLRGIWSSRCQCRLKFYGATFARRDLGGHDARDPVVDDRCSAKVRAGVKSYWLTTLRRDGVAKSNKCEAKRFLHVQKNSFADGGYRL